MADPDPDPHRQLSALNPHPHLRKTTISQKDVANEQDHRTAAETMNAAELQPPRLHWVFMATSARRKR